MDKDKLLAALNKIQEGQSAGYFHDELETIIGLVMNIADEAITAAWSDLRTDTV